MCVKLSLNMYTQLRSVARGLKTEEKKTNRKPPKFVNSRVLSLFMEIDGKCNNSYAFSTGLSSVLLSAKPHIFLKDQNMNKINNELDVRGEFLLTPHGTTTAVLNNLENGASKYVV